VVDFLSFFNADSATVTLTVKFDENGTEFNLWQGTLATGERLEYADGQGFRSFTAAGAEKVQQSVGLPTSTGEVVASTSANVVNNNAVANTLENVTGLVLPVLSGVRYWFKATIPYSAAATTTGSRWSLTGPAVSQLNYYSKYTLTSTTFTSNFLSAFSLPAASNATSLTVGNIALLEGIIIPSADGDLQVVFASEVSASAITALAGAFLRLRAL
jgi:hypothetical protein